MTRDFRFREYGPEDYDAIRNLINLVQPRQPWSRAHFEWQYLRCPAGKARVWVVEYQGRIVASYAAIPHHFEIRKRRVIAWRVQDVLTHPGFRGLGLMHELSTLCAESICCKEFPLNYTFPNEYSHRSFLRRGWIEAYRIPLRIVVNLSENRASTGDDSDSVVAASQFHESVDELWSRSKSDFHYAVSRTSSYLTWRYFHKPGTRYFPFVEIHNGVLNGLLVMKYHDSDDGLRLAHICELLVTPGDEIALRNLIARAFGFGVDMRAERLTAWLSPGHPYEPTYDSAGFAIDESIRRWLVVRSTPETPGVDSPEEWHLSMGDSDVY